MKAKKLVKILVLLMPPMLTDIATAADGFVKGNVEYVRVHHSSAQPIWAPPKFWFTLKGVSSAGGCPAWASGTVLFVSDSKEAMSIILSSYTAGKEVAVRFNDQLKDNGWCIAEYITLGSPPPEM